MKCAGHIAEIASVAVLLLGLQSAAQAQENATTAGEVSAVATIYCIGIDWPIDGDANHNAACQVEYRGQGAADWNRAMPLLRCDSDRTNSLTGSILFLDPATEYEVRLTLADPDGGGATESLAVRTQPVPAIPTGGRTFHVTPGNEGGDGSEATPFRGIAAAEQAARPGDILLLHAGDYGVVELSKSGDRDNCIVWKAASDGDAVIRGLSPASWVWIEGLSFRMDPDFPLQSDRYISHGHTTGIAALQRGASNVVISRCTFRDFHYSMDLRRCSEWYIADNDIQGDNDPISGGLGGEGIELNRTSGHTVAHNRISRVADGISYPNTDCDIFRNDILDVSDDGIEPDYGNQNNRIWENRITRTANAVFSFQPINRGPWYYIRNHVVTTRGIVWKFARSVKEPFVAVNNTFLFPGQASQYAQCMLLSFSRNNLYISTGQRGIPIWRGAWHPRNPGEPGVTMEPFWMTDMDYDGYDWDGLEVPFIWDRTPYADLAGFAAGVGIEKHAIRVDKEDIFENWTTPSAEIDSPPVDMVLKAGSNAVDAGDVVPNINDDFTGAAPDLGALELGKPLPHYGPRP